MFEGCSSLTSLYLKNFNTESTIDMRSMFKGCTGITELDLSSFNTNNLNLLSDMFGNIGHEIKVKVTESIAAKIINEYEWDEYVKFEFVD